MAKVLYSTQVGDMRGKVGGAVHTKGRFGSFIRRKVSPIQPRSTTQRNVRADFTALSKAWSGSTMDDTKRAAWNALAANYPQKDVFGASHTLTGLQMFVKLNRTIHLFGNPTITTPPPTLAAGYPGALTVVATVAGPNTLTVAYAGTLGVAEHAIFYAAAQVSPGKLSIGNRYRYVFETSAAGAVDISAPYVAKFGGLIATKKVPILVRFGDVTTGALGTPSAALKVVS